MEIFLIVFLVFFTFVSIKQILFWIYLWQLKEYYIPRFLDHFHTAKGRQVIFNKIRLVKIIFLILAIFSFISMHQIENIYYIFLILVLLIIYVLESFTFTKQILFKTVKKPKITGKSLFLILSCVVFSFLFLILTKNPIDLLVLDIFLPIIVSLVVLMLQPIVVLARNKILKKAKIKMLSMKNLIVIGITGSYGKTTTKEFLTTILSSKFKTLSTEEHKNSEMGIAGTILKQLTPEHQIFVVEMGAYKKGGIKLLADIVKPRIGMVTGVTVQHLSLFGSLENLLSAEGGRELVEALPKNGFIAVNGENKYCIDLYKQIKNNKLIYTEEGNKIDSDIFAKEIQVSKDFLSFVAVTKNKHIAHFNVKILGRHNLQNLLGAILIAKELGMTLEEISEACKNIKPEQAGIVVKKGVHQINITDSSYSSNPDGVIADLDCLKLFSGKRVVIMPCLIELGEKSKDEHYKIGQKIGEICDLAIITSKDKFSEIKNGARDVIPAKAGIQKPCEIIFVENSQEIFHKITTFCKAGDVVLLEGRVPEKLIKLLINEK